MPRRLPAVVILLGLAACAAGHGALTARAPTAAAQPPKPADGLWAMLDPGCAKPGGADFHAWPHCASPFWISGRKVLLILADPAGKSAVRDTSYAADMSLTPGEPLIAQVGAQKDGYMFLALTDLTRDAQGRVVGASGVAVACGKAPDGAAAVKPTAGGCDQADLATVRKAAAATLRDHAALTQAAWIAPGAPRAGD